MAGTKNLGQVAGLFIGTTPPENTSLIWYDSTPSMQCHKVYSVTLGQWVVLDDNTILAVEYSVLRNRAQDPGLSVGQWFKITDKDNALALAITSTKVQYVDSIGNILIDDLSASIQYHVTHQNLLIDDVHGVFDTVNKRLVFEFSEVSAVNFLGDDFMLAERKVNNVWSLFKIKFSKLLSTTSGNAITWDNGFYLNFTQRFTNMLDVTGGAVSKATFDSTVASIRTDLTNVSNNQQSMAEQAAAAIDSAVTDDMIFGKRLPSEPDTSTGPADILEGDTLQMIVNKVQRWFNSLKWATGIGLSDDYAEATENFNVNNNDSVETAIAKLAGHVRALQQGSDNGTDNVIVSPGYDDAPTSDNGAGAGSVLTRLLEKLRYYSIKHEDTDGVKVASAFENEPTSGNQTITPGTTALTTLLTKFQYWINTFKTTDGPWLADSYSPQNRNVMPGVALTRVLEKFAYDIAEIFASPWRVPYYSVLIFYRQPIYDNIIGNPTDYQKRIGQFAGKSWFPCGKFFVGSSSDCDAEQAKWDALYGAGSISWSRSYNGTNYALRMTAYHGIIIPDLSNKFLMGYDSENPNASYGTNGIGLTGGSHTHTLNISEMPKHNHGSATYTDNPDSADISTLAKSSDSVHNGGEHKHKIYLNDKNYEDGHIRLDYVDTDSSIYSSTYTNDDKNDGSHQHTVRLYSRGSGTPIDIRPAFITVGYIIRLPS